MSVAISRTSSRVCSSSSRLARSPECSAQLAQRRHVVYMNEPVLPSSWPSHHTYLSCRERAVGGGLLPAEVGTGWPSLIKLKTKLKKMSSRLVISDLCVCIQYEHVITSILSLTLSRG